MKYYKYIKTVTDRIFALSLLLLLTPVLLFVGIIIKMDSKGPIIFKQNRPGKDKRIFTIYKFRTMNIDNKSNSDINRITKIGKILRKTSLDEFPQLINILKGEMSFIGPRPLLVEYLDVYNDEEMRRHEIRPGITGLAQVNGRNSIKWEEKFRYDIYYLENMSLLLDLKIILKTIKIIITRYGVDYSYKEIMPYFHGKDTNNIS